MPLTDCSVSVRNSRQARSPYNTHNHSFILPPETCIPLYLWGIFLLSPHILFLITILQKRNNSTCPFPTSLHLEPFLHFLQCALCRDECPFTCLAFTLSAHMWSPSSSLTILCPLMMCTLPFPSPSLVGH